MTDLNLAGESHAHSLIDAGKVDRTSSWSFDAEDGNAMLGQGGEDWDTYSKFHLGVDRSAAEKTKGRFKYPYGKGGKVYRSGVIAAKSRAGQQGDGAIEKAAGALLEAIDGQSKGADLDGFKTALCRFEYKFVDVSGGPTGSFEGYGAAFNNKDGGGDVILPGAFERVLAEHKAAGTMPKMLLNHGGLDNFFANPSPEDLLPVGKWNSMTEDSRGLQCKGQLINLDTESGKRLHGAMKESAIDGLSIAYVAGKFARGSKKEDPQRTISEMKSLIEVGPVTFPMNTEARISAVKSFAGIGTLREFGELKSLMDDRQCAADAVAAAIRLQRAMLGGSDNPSAEERTALLTHLQTAHKALTGEPMPYGMKNMPSTIREFERCIREMFSLSNAEARAIAEHGFKQSRPRDEGDDRATAAKALGELRTSLADFSLSKF